MTHWRKILIGVLAMLTCHVVTGNSQKTPGINQLSDYAEEITRRLADIVLPKGFHIELFALVPGARHMAISPHSATVWVGTRRNKVWVVRDDEEQATKTVQPFGPGTAFVIPNGVCYAPDGWLYVVELNRILAFPQADHADQHNNPESVPVVAQGELVPESDTAFNHGARVCVIGPDDRLYVSLGQPYNVTPPNKRALYDELGMGGMIRMKRDGSGRKVIATGIRNSVGHAFNPEDGSLWFTDNQVDGMGDEIPPGELNRLSVTDGENNWFGFPYFGGGEVRTFEYANKEIPEELLSRYVSPQVEMGAHAADLGMMFYTGNTFPTKYHNAIFSAQHGSWDASDPRGARVMVTFLNEAGNAERSQPFAEGWLQKDGSYSGRPVDVQQYVDGSILVSDDKAGAIYRIYYREQ